MTTNTEKQIERISEIEVDGKNAAAVALGRRGGAAISEAKAKSSRANQKKAIAARKKKAKQRRMQDPSQSAHA